MLDREARSIRERGTFEGDILAYMTARCNVWGLCKTVCGGDAAKTAAGSVL